MTIEEVKQTYAWNEAISLSRQLVEICEAFSDADTNELVWHLRQSVVDIPAQIAADLQSGRDASLEPAVKLVTILELVTKIYPAIETGEADESLQRLIDRLQSDNFSQTRPQPKKSPGLGPKTARSDQSQATAEITESEDDDKEDDAGPVMVVQHIDGVGRQSQG